MDKLFNDVFSAHKRFRSSNGTNPCTQPEYFQRSSHSALQYEARGLAGLQPLSAQKAHVFITGSAALRDVWVAVCRRSYSDFSFFLPAAKLQ